MFIFHLENLSYERSGVDRKYTDRFKATQSVLTHF